jgi:asparagine synthase (glutamine-hydrolysing)
VWHYRRKEAFSDGVSGDTKSWKDEISDRIDKLGKITKGQIDLVCLNNPDLTREQAYYKMLFQIKVVNNDDLFDSGFRRQLATRWMPRFISATDPSARTLDIY